MPGFEIEELNRPPAEALAGLTGDRGKALRITSLTLTRIRGRAVYKIAIEGGASELIDTRSGERFEVTPEIAEQIVRDNFPTEAAIQQLDRVDHHDLSYLWGPLPAYRIALSEELGTLYHVSIRDGTIQRSGRWDRIRTVIESLHTFEPLRRVIKQDAVRNGLLALFSLIGVGAAITGYYLAISGRRA
jgi:hypothetical protein